MQGTSQMEMIQTVMHLMYQDFTLARHQLYQEEEWDLNDSFDKVDALLDWHRYDPAALEDSFRKIVGKESPLQRQRGQRQLAGLCRVVTNQRGRTNCACSRHEQFCTECNEYVDRRWRPRCHALAPTTDRTTNDRTSDVEVEIISTEEVYNSTPKIFTFRQRRNRD
jgi:hypothetical protein